MDMTRTEMKRMARLLVEEGYTSDDIREATEEVAETLFLETEEVEAIEEDLCQMVETVWDRIVYGI